MAPHKTSAGDIYGPAGLELTTQFPGERIRIGNRLVPSRIEARIPSVNGQPGVEAAIEVRLGVPRLVELRFTSPADAREIRTHDVQALNLESLVAVAVARVASIVDSDTEAGYSASLSAGEADVRAAIAQIRDVRRGSRRQISVSELQQVADVYNAHESGGLLAVKAAFVLSDTTAKRRVRLARAAGLIEKREK